MGRRAGARVVALVMMGLALAVVMLTVRQQAVVTPTRVWVRGTHRQRVTLRAGTYQVWDTLYDDDTEPPADVLVVPGEPQLIGPVPRSKLQLGAQVVAGRASWFDWLEPDWEAPYGYSPQAIVRVRASGDYRVQDLVPTGDDGMFLGPTDREYEDQTVSLIVDGLAIFGILLGLVTFWRRARLGAVLESSSYDRS